MKKVSQRCIKALAVASAVTLVPLYPAASSAADFSLIPGQTNEAAPPSWAKYAVLNVGGMIPGDCQEVGATVANGGTTAGRLKWGFTNLYPRNTSTGAEIQPTDPEYRFFNDLQGAWAYGQANLEALTQEQMNSFVSQYTMNAFVPYGSVDLAPGQESDYAAYQWCYNATSTTPPARTTSVRMGLAFRMYGLEDPAEATVVDEAGYSQDSVTPPQDTPGITYSEFTYDQKTGAYSYRATANNGYEFTSGKTTQVITGQLNVAAPVLEPAAPTVVDQTGYADDSVTAPEDSTEIAYSDFTYDQKTGAWSYTATIIASNPDAVFSNGLRTMVLSGTLDVTTPPAPTPEVTIPPGETGTPIPTPTETTTPPAPPETTPPAPTPTTPAPTPSAPTPTPTEGTATQTPVVPPAPTTPPGTSSPTVTAPTPAPPVRYETRTFQVDRYKPKTKKQAYVVSSLTRDGVLRYREDRALWGATSYQFVTVRVPEKATHAQVMKAINAKTNKYVGDVNSGSKLYSSAPGRQHTIVWELGRGATPKLAWGANKKVNQRFFARG